MSIKSFKQKWLERFYYEDKGANVQPQIRDRVFKKLQLLDFAVELDDLRHMPGNKLHPLSHDRKGQWAIAVNGEWRLCFYFRNGDVYEVELVQYH